jgi:hypothetical protein
VEGVAGTIERKIAALFKGKKPTVLIVERLGDATSDSTIALKVPPSQEKKKKESSSQL